MDISTYIFGRNKAKDLPKIRFTGSTVIVAVMRINSRPEYTEFDAVEADHQGIKTTHNIAHNTSLPYNTNLSLTKTGLDAMKETIFSGEYLGNIQYFQCNAAGSLPNTTDLSLLGSLVEVNIVPGNHAIDITPLKKIKKITCGNVRIDLRDLENNEYVNITPNANDSSNTYVSNWFSLENKPTYIKLAMPNPVSNTKRVVFNPLYMFSSIFDTLILTASSTNYVGIKPEHIDNILNQMALSITVATKGKLIDLRISGYKRTSASNAAVSYLQGLGFTILN